MGRDKDEKKDKRRRSPSPSSSLEEGKGKRVKRSSSSSKGDEEAKRVKKDKKHKSRDKSSSKHHSHHKGIDSDKKSGEKHKVKSHKDDGYSKLKIPEISSDDYFSKSNEFATWLKEEKNKFFSDLSSEASRELFSKFVKEWNKHRLESRYYEGITSGPRTSHKWNLK